MTPAELKARWIEELRSGKHDQAKYALECAGALCCLGVLSLVQGRIPKGGLFPDDRIIEAAGLSRSIRNLLSHMNDGSDGHGEKSFPEIADWIETHDLATGEPL